MSCPRCGGKGWYKAGGTWESCNYCDKNRVRKNADEPERDLGDDHDWHWRDHHDR